MRKKKRRLATRTTTRLESLERRDLLATISEFAPLAPRGSQAYEARGVGDVPAGGQESISISLDAGQTISVVIQPAGSEYQVTSAPMSWADAEAEAVALGGHLVAINDEDEQELLNELFLAGDNESNRYWIGFTDAAEEGVWIWSNGDPVTYTNWLPGEPNNANNNEDAAIMNWAGPNQLGRWNDELSTRSQLGIIEFSDAGTLRAVVAVTSPSGANLATATAGKEGEAVVFQSLPVETAGEYTITVSGLDGSNGAFQSRVLLNAAFENESFIAQTNNSLASAQSIDGAFRGLVTQTAGRHGSVTGELPTDTGAADYAERNQDWYSFALEEGETITLTATDRNHAEVVRLELYDAAGNKLADGDPAPTNVGESLSFAAAGAGLFYARVSFIGQGATPSGGHYTLTASVAATFDLEENSGSAPWAGGAFQDLGIGGAVIGGIDDSVFMDFVPAGVEGLFGAYGMAVRDGDVYVVSRNTPAVLRFDRDTGAPKPAAGKDGALFASAGLTDPMGLAFGPDGRLYVSQYNGDNVMRYDGETGALVDEFVTAGSGGLDGAFAVAFGPGGHLFVTSNLNHSIMRYDGLTGAPLPSSGSSGAAFSKGSDLAGPRFIAFGPDGQLYVPSAQNQQIVRYDSATGDAIDIFVSSGLGDLQSPRGLAFDERGDLFVGDASTGRVLRYQGPQSANPGAFHGTYFTTTNAQGMLAFDDAGLLLVATGGAHSILQERRDFDFFRVALGAGEELAATMAAPFSGPLEPRNELFPRLRLFDETGSLVAESQLDENDTAEIAFETTAGGFYYVQVSGGYTAGDYVLQVEVETSTEPRLVVLDAAPVFEGHDGQTVAEFVVQLNAPADVPITVAYATRDGSATIDDNDYVAQSGVLEFAPGQTKHSVTVAIQGDRIDEPDETFYVDLSDPTGDARIVRGTAMGVIRNDDGPIEISIGDAVVIEGDRRMRFLDAIVDAGAATDLRGLLLGPDVNGDGRGELYAADHANHRVLRFDGFTGELHDVLVAAGEGGLTSPRFLAIDDSGRLLVSSHSADGLSDRVLAYDAFTGSFIGTAVESGGLQNLGDFAIGPDVTGDAVADLYVSSGGTNQVLLYDGVSGAFVRVFVGDDPATPGIDESGGLAGPAGLAFDALGNLYVSSSQSKAVLRYDRQGAVYKRPNGFPFVADFPETPDYDDTEGLVQPGELAFGAQGDIYVVDDVLNEVFRYDRFSGAFIDRETPGSGNSLISPAPGLAIDAEGVLYLSRGEGQVHRYGPSSFAVVTISLSQPAETPFTIDFTTADGTAPGWEAVLGADYKFAAGRLSFAPGESSKMVIVTTIDDGEEEAPEKFFVRLSNLTTTGGRAVELVDDEGEILILDTISTVYSSESLPVEITALDDLPSLVFFDALNPALYIHDSYPIFDLQVQVDVSHPRVSDFYLLYTRLDYGWSDVFIETSLKGADLQNTRFDDEATHHILQGEAPFEGAFRPSFRLRFFDGLNSRQLHYLLPIDQEDGVEGFLNKWSLILTRVQAPRVTVRAVGPAQTSEAGGSATFEVVLDYPPTADVTLPISVSNTAEGAVSVSSLLFTSKNWRTPQTVVVTGVDDSLIDGDVAYNLIVGRPVSDDLAYNTLAAQEFALTNLNDDTRVFISNTTVRENSAGGVALGVFASNVGMLPHHVVFGPNGDLFVTSLRSDEVLRIDGATGETLGAFVSAGAGGLDNPTDLAFGPDGNLYVVSQVTDTILRYDGQTGAFLDVFARASDSPDGFVGLQGLVFGPGGDLYVGTFGSAILRFDGASGALLGEFVVAGSGGLNEPKAIAFGPDGDLYVTSHLTDQILRYDGQSGAFREVFVAAGEGGMQRPFGLAFGPDGDLFVSSRAHGVVVRYDGQNGAALDNFAWANAPRGIAFGPDGLLYVVDVLGSRIERFIEGPAAVFTVGLRAPSTEPVSVEVSFADGTAVAGEDYTQVGPMTVFFAPGETSKTVFVPILADGTSEGVESFQATLSSPIGATIDDGVASGYIVDEVVRYTRSAPVAISDGAAAVSTITIDEQFDVYGVTVEIDIAHTYLSDLTISLIGPGGETVKLVEEQGEDADDFRTTVFDDQAPAPIAIPRLGSKVGFNLAPFRGRFRPEGSLAAFDGTSAQGQWTLGITDSFAEDNGTLNSWSLTVGRPLPVLTPGVRVLASQPLLTSESGGASQFTVALTSPPTSNVEISIASSDASEAIVSPAVLVFTALNWSLPQVVTVTGQDDAIADGDIPYVVVFGPIATADPNYAQLTIPSLTAFNYDDDHSAPGAMFVWDIAFTSYYETGASWPSARVSVQIKHDSNLDGAADALDSPVAGASLSILLVNYETGISAVLTGVADGGGVFTSKPFGVSSGTYYAEVVGLSHPNFNWSGAYDPVLGNDGDFDSDGLPDQWLDGVSPVPAGASDSWHNESHPNDVDGDGWITNVDALLVVGALRRSGPGPLSGSPPSDPQSYIDVSGDGHLTSLDALLVAGRLRASRRGDIAAASEATDSIDGFFAENSKRSTEAEDRKIAPDEALLAYLQSQASSTTSDEKLKRRFYAPFELHLPAINGSSAARRVVLRGESEFA